jgi:hypothetical protein
VDAILDGTPAISAAGAVAATPGAATPGAATPGAAPGTLPVKPEVVLSAAPVQQVAASSKPKDAQKAKNGLPEEMDGQVETQKAKRFSIGSTLSRFLWSETSTELLSPISPAVQVNLILQEKLKNTPLEDRGICLMELPGQDMVVMIGEDKYDSVSAVPDDEIRGIIQASVNEWLARSTR